MYELVIPEILGVKAKKLAATVHRWHYPQRRKYTKEPYSRHLVRVAVLVLEHTANGNLVAAALCHDVLEDTDITEQEIQEELITIGYSQVDTLQIIALVVELTDIYTKTNFPTKNRTERKALELERLLQITPVAASIKLADLIDNLRDLLVQDKGFARVYIRETLPLLEKAVPYPSLQALAIAEYDIAKRELNEWGNGIKNADDNIRTSKDQKR